MSFDTLAPHYRWLEFVLAGEKLQRCRTAFLDRITARNILIAGEGNGRFLAECRSRLPTARITVVDFSARMLEIARQRLLRSGAETDGIEFVHANLLTWRPEERAYDLIVTQFFFDCFPAGQLRQVVASLASAATPGAAWLLADFQMPDAGLRRYRAQLVHALMYTFFRVMTQLPARKLVEPDGFLAAHDFAVQERRTDDWDLLRTDLWKRRQVVPGLADSP
jgi:ubiquinone/menaquinone biosynthesis C-methylase UbiE